MSDRYAARDKSDLISSSVDALLIVDMQNGFLKDQQNLIKKVAELARSFPPERTWWLKYRNYPDSSFIKRLYWSEVMVPPQTDIEPSLLPLAKNTVEHISYLPGSEMVDALQGSKYVAIAGVDTDACVYATAFFLWQHDMFPIILQDHCGSSGGANFHRPALDMIRRQFGVDAVVSNITPSPFALSHVPKMMQTPVPG